MAHESVLLVLLLASLAISAVNGQGQLALACYLLGGKRINVKFTYSVFVLRIFDDEAELDMGWVHPWVGLGRVGSTFWQLS